MRKERERGIYRGDGKRLYYTCLGAFSLRLREQDEKARTSRPVLLPRVPRTRTDGHVGGEVGGTPWYPPKRGG